MAPVALPPEAPLGAAAASLWLTVAEGLAPTLSVAVGVPLTLAVPVRLAVPVAVGEGVGGGVGSGEGGGVGAPVPLTLGEAPVDREAVGDCDVVELPLRVQEGVSKPVSVAEGVGVPVCVGL